MAVTTPFQFTLLNGSDPAGHNTINNLIESINSRLNTISTGLANGATGTVTTGEVLRWDGTTFAKSFVDATSLATNSVTEAKIAAGAITEAKIASGAVTSAKIQDGAVTSAKIADGTITETDLAFSVATQAELDAHASDTTSIHGITDTSALALKSGNTYTGTHDYTGATIIVPTATAGDNDTSAASTAFVTGAISTAVASVTAGTSFSVGGDLSGTTGNATIVNGAVTSDKILNGTIVNGDINASAAIAYSKLNLAGSITQADLVSALQQLLIPVGTLMPFAGLAASKPTGWFICDGSSFASNGLSAGNALYDLLVAAGWSALPDLQGRTIAGTGTGSGLSARALRDIFGQETLPAHTHSISAWATTDGAGAHSHSVSHTDQVYQGTGPGIWPAGNNGVNGYGAGNQGHSVSTNGAHNHTIPATNTNSTGTGSHGVMQPTLFLNYIIKG